MKQALLEYKCPNCGGNVTFDIKTQRMKCPFCSSEFSVFAFNSDAAEWTEEEQDSIRLYNCGSCGGDVIADATASATSCPYCDGALVMAGRVSGKRKPDYIIPFKLDKKAAVAGFKKHLSNKKLLPKVFKDAARIEECCGVYVPFWLFDADFKMTARVRGETGGKRSRTVYFDYEAVLPFRRIPVDGCKRLSNAITESLEPYRFNAGAVPFNASYLAGYLADMYDVDKKECIGRVVQRMTSNAKKEIYKNFMQKGYLYSSTTINEAYLKNHSSMYALFPVWLLGVRWKDKRYTFAMNGQTGKFVGNLPYDKSDAAKRFLSVFLGAFSIGMLITLLIWFFVL